MSHETIRRLVRDAYNTQSAGLTVGLPRVSVDASQLQALLKHHDHLKAERDAIERRTIERCAEVCDQLRNDFLLRDNIFKADGADLCAAAIRALLEEAGE